MARLNLRDSAHSRVLRFRRTVDSVGLDNPPWPNHHVDISGCHELQRLSDIKSVTLSIMDLEIQVASRENVSILRCRGRLIYGPETAELVRAARQAFEATKQIVLQMADVIQIDSGGVGALGTAFIAAHNREAEIKLAALQPRVAEVLRITGLDLLFDIRESESEALAAFLTKQKSDAMDLTGTAETAGHR